MAVAAAASAPPDVAARCERRSRTLAAYG